MFRYLLYALLISILTFSLAEESVESVTKAQVQNNQLAKQSQETLSQMADETDELNKQYRDTLKVLEATKIYNEQLRKTIEHQESEKLSIREQIREVKYTDKQIIPLMVEMLNSLEQFIRLDIPFLKKERTNRVEELKSIMARSDVTTSEKYRRITEAYQIENEYGRTIGVYRDLQNVKEKPVTVNFLRIGRLSLIYQTLDKKQGAYWSQKEKKWIPIKNRYRKAVSLGIQIAQKQIAPNFVLAWIPNPTSQTITLPAIQTPTRPVNSTPEKTEATNHHTNKDIKEPDNKKKGMTDE